MKQANRFWRLIALTVFLSVSAGAIFYRIQQDQKEKIDMHGVIDPETLVVNKAPVREIKTGITYISFFAKSDVSNPYNWSYYRVVDQSNLIAISDAAHWPQSAYVKNEDEDKVIAVRQSQYKKKGKNFIPTQSVVSVHLLFNLAENVKRGSAGEYFASTDKQDLADALQFINGHYFANTPLLDGHPSPLYRAKEQIPNSVDGYLKQYNVTLRP
ncbi:MAG: hypothetical protein LKI92_12375 [Schleiferilactobacillus harbinensis]|jgi:hypothetical protein|nr:hypothetical protein [Schleiferilactobacillus harbinensis]